MSELSPRSGPKWTFDQLALIIHGTVSFLGFYVPSDERLSVFLELERVTGVSLGEKKFARTPRKPPATNKGSCLAPKVVSHFSLVQPRKLSGLKARFNLPDQKGRLSLREGEGRVRVTPSPLFRSEGSNPSPPAFAVLRRGR